jgi:hypothetical protein
MVSPSTAAEAAVVGSATGAAGSCGAGGNRRSEGTKKAERGSDRSLQGMVA